MVHPRRVSTLHRFLPLRAGVVAGVVAVAVTALAPFHCAEAQHAPATVPAVAGNGATLAVHGVALPGSPGAVRMDYLAFDPAHHAVWIPAGNTARVDVLDTESGALSSVEGFATVERVAHGARRVVGPSSVAVGETQVYIGNRADASVCALDMVTRHRGACVTLPSSPDGVVWVPATRALWVTAPSSHALLVLPADAAGALQAPVSVPVEGEPEGYAVDATRGIFYTNLEDRDRTLAIDVRTRQVVATWNPGCGAAGPRGLALDPVRRHLFVACTDHVVTLDAGHDGAVLGHADTGRGVDNISYTSGRDLVFAAAGGTATLRVLHADPQGNLTVVGTAATGPGARVVVSDARGRAYVADSEGGRIVVAEPPP